MLFFKNMVELQHSFVDDKGIINGGSVSVSVVVDGVSPSARDEVRAELTSALIDSNTSFKNKLWLIEGFSKYQSKRVKRGVVSISTPCFEAELPGSAIVEILGGPYGPEVVSTAIKNAVQAKLREAFPSCEVKINAQMAPILNSPVYATFTYLDNEVTNGTFAFVEFYKMVNTEEEADALQELANDIAKTYDRTFFVSPSKIMDSKIMKIEQYNGWIIIKAGHQIIQTSKKPYEEILERFGARIRAAQIDLSFVSDNFNEGFGLK